jgi:hypothetical protein
LGIFAASDISRNTLILKERPLLCIDTGVPEKEWGDACIPFFANERSGRSTHIAGIVQQLNGQDMKTFRRLHCPQSMSRDVDCVERNAFAFPIRDLVRLFIYPKLSRANHSCRPNATVIDMSHVLDATQGQVAMRLFSTTKIPAGAEVLISYNPDWVWHSTRIRQADLRLHWMFLCSCVACLDPQDDEFRVRLRSSRRAIGTPSNTSLGKAELYVELLQEAGVGDERLSHG